ncbi:MAG: ABC transporter ATP-binding protein [Defluviitaleaceae bacterium]|nr:ABC transporter ATP-binding protein [Defluviitaleaceae bacterium]
MGLELKNVSYSYEGGTERVLRNINAQFESGKIYAIVGESGAGKSTLLSLISGLDTCKEGEVLYNGKSLKTLDRDEYRSQHIGVIFQSFNLLLNSTAVYNITLSMNISGVAATATEKKRLAYELLAKVGIDRETADRKILRLSGGEQQRVGIARALSHNPAVIIADEPTGNLDEITEGEILDIFAKLAHGEGKCVIIVTHSDEVSAAADRVLRLVGGRIL